MAEQGAPGDAQEAGRASARVVVSSRYASALKRSDQAEALVREIVESTEVPL